MKIEKYSYRNICSRSKWRIGIGLEEKFIRIELIWIDLFIYFK